MATGQLGQSCQERLSVAGTRLLRPFDVSILFEEIPFVELDGVLILLHRGATLPLVSQSVCRNRLAKEQLRIDAARRVACEEVGLSVLLNE